jgi:hypothetical protein
MLKAERLELSKLVRQRAKVAKGEADQRASLLRADFEEQLAAIHPLDHQAWDSLTEEVVERIKAVNKEIAKRSAELGIPERFCPSICWSWRSRGENLIKDRRTELRMVAQTRITERVKRAKCEIDRRSVDLQTQLAQDGLETEQAKKFLAALPSVEELLPTLAFKELEDDADKHYALLHRFD